VPIQEVISHLGSALPQCALRSAECPDPWGANGEPPPPPPPPPPNPNTFPYNATNTNNAQQNTVNRVIALAEGDKINLGTCGVNGAVVSGDTYLRVFNPSGTEVASNDDACGGRGSNIVYTVPVGAGGNYEVRAGCYSSGTCGGTVAWEITGGTPPPPPPPPPPGSSGTFAFNATNTSSATRGTVNQDITAAAGQRISLGTCGLTGASFSGNTWLRLVTSSGTEVASNNDACGGTGSNASYTVPSGAGGTFQIRAGCNKNTSCSGTVAWSVQ
jgi:hypothetical protein